MADNDDTGDADNSTENEQPNGDTSDSGEQDVGELLKRLEKLEAERDSWKKRSRQHEDRAKQNADAAREKQTTEEQIEQLRKDIADRDAQDIADKQDLAVEKLHAKLVRGRMSDEDATALVEMIDPMRLLADGKPDAREIDKVAKSLTKIGGRSTPDPDQGRRGGDQTPTGMSDLIRQGARAKNKI